MYFVWTGLEPFSEWREKLPLKEKVAVTRYILRAAGGGGKKNIKALGDGIFEIKVHIGPGLRIYYGEDGKRIILLLMGGDKGSQKRDIEKAKDYWRSYVSRK